MTKIAFRFCFLYFGLFCLLFAQITFAFAGMLGGLLPPSAVLWQLQALEPLLSWVGWTVFGVDAHLHPDSGSGDQAVLWVLVFVLFVIAVSGAMLWSVLDRDRPGYHRLWSWFLTLLRLCVAGQMLFYGFAKVIPSQMPAPPLATLLRPFGELSPASVLWLQVGSSPPYEIALGAVEVVAGVLLFWPRTATLGALAAVASMAQVFLLNMTFDVPVKILSGHLLAMGVLLLVPQAGRMADFFVLQRVSAPARQPELFDDKRRNTVAAGVQLALGAWVLIGCAWGGWQSWNEFGGGRDKPELYGIWEVSRFELEGNPVPPLTTDDQRWLRVVFDTPQVLTYQLMDGTLVDAPIERDGDTLVVSAPDDSRPTRLTASRPDPDRLHLVGELAGRPVQMWLDHVDLDRFTLRNRGFHWVQDYPYFR